jgi:hypothetical protein
MATIPIPDIVTTLKAPITQHTRAILYDPESPDTPRLEKQIDQMVYQLYGLTEEEIKIVEGGI